MPAAAEFLANRADIDCFVFRTYATALLPSASSSKKTATMTRIARDID
jgi:hypothetical protein